MYTVYKLTAEGLEIVAKELSFTDANQMVHDLESKSNDSYCMGLIAL